MKIEEQLAFYRAYHRNAVNVLVHVVFVPLIYMASIALATNIAVQDNPYINLGSMASLAYALFYVYLDELGLLVAPAILLYSIKMTSLIHFTSPAYALNVDLPFSGSHQLSINQLAVTIFVIGWLMQFMSHGVFEKRAPALLDNLVQAFVLAPLFVVFEVLFVLGMRQDVLVKMNRIADRNIAQFKAEKSKSKTK